MPPTRPVRLVEIARASKFSVATVSRALRNHPAIPVKTRQRVQEVATRLGYRPNPMMGALMTQIRTGAPSSEANLACLHGEPRSSDIFQMQTEFLTGMQSAAGQFGYNIELFEYSAKTDCDQLQRIWKARNVRGVVLSHLRASAPLQLPWNEFAWVVNGHITGAPDLHRVGNAIYEIVKAAVQEALQRGYRRPGLAVRLKDRARVGFRWPAAFIGNLLRYDCAPDMSWIFQDEWTLPAFRSWVRKRRPDVVLSLFDEPYRWLEQMKIAVPEQVGFLHLAANMSDLDASGVAQDFRRVGEAAIYTIDSELRRSEIGIPPAPVTFTVAGSWREGATLPRRTV